MTDRSAPLRGAILVGGSSSRMGRPKALVEFHGVTLSERVHAALAPLVDSVVVSGGGAIPPPISGLERVGDAPGLRGPLAGIAALVTHDPAAAWLVCACDMPLVTPEACAWLVAQRAPDVLAVVPRPRGGRPEPLLAIYEPAARGPILALTGEPGAGPSQIANLAGAATPVPPAHLEHAWRDADTEEELAALRQPKSSPGDPA